MSNSWKIKDMVDGVNTAIAAAASEQIISGTNSAPFFNSLVVTNLDAVDIEIYLDGQNVPGRRFNISHNGGLAIDPEESIHFNSITQKNIDGAVAETAGLIRFTAMFKEAV
jgi:hypothetical protein